MFTMSTNNEPLGSMLALEKDEIIEVTRKKRTKQRFPGFTIFGSGKETRYGGKSMDILEVCQQLNRGEMELMKFIRDEIEGNKSVGELNPNKVVPANSEEITPYLKIALKKNFPHMECLGILKRVKRGTYMANPDLFIPPSGIEGLRIVWNSIEERDCND